MAAPRRPPESNPPLTGEKESTSPLTPSKPASSSPSAPPASKLIEKSYHIYTGTDGKPVSRVERQKFSDGSKKFRQQRPSGGGWINGLGGIEVPLYNLVGVVKAVREGKRLYVVEGEKHVDELSALDLPATTNPMGAGKWRSHHTEALKGASVIILPDNDEPGRKHAEQVAEVLSAVAAEVRVLDLPELPPKGDVLDWLAAGGTKDELIRLADAAPIYRGKAPEAKGGDKPDVETIEQEWEPPVPFDEPDLPAFPVEVFPSWLRSWVVEESEATQTPVDLAAMIALSVLAAASQRRVRIRLWEGYAEPLNLYTAIVMPPGSRKSAVMADATRVLREWEREKADGMRDQVAQAESRLRRMEKKLRLAEEKVAKMNQDNPDTKVVGEETDNLAVEVADLQRCLPVLPRLLADDVTPEKVVQLLAEQGGRMAVFSSEGGIFETMAGRYSNSVPNLDAFLKAHTGEDVVADRMTRRGSHVKAAALTFCLAVQPDVIRSISDQKSFRGRGLTARFLYSLPKGLVGYRQIRSTSLPEHTRDTYEAAVRKLLDGISGGPDDFYYLELSDGARRAFEGFAAWVEPRLKPSGEFGFMADWGGKLVGAVARVAGLLHMAGQTDGRGNPATAPVAQATMEAASAVGYYLAAHAKAAHCEMGEDGRTDDAKHLWGWIVGRGDKAFPKQAIWQGMRARFRKVEPLDQALRLLCERGFLRETTPERKGRAGRKPAPVYEVNQLAVG